MFILTTGQLHAASLVSFAILAYTAAEFNGNNGAAKPRDSSASCSRPKNPNSWVQPDQQYYSVNETLTITCDSGYELSNGKTKDTLTCKNVKWNKKKTDFKCREKPMIMTHNITITHDTIKVSWNSIYSRSYRYKVTAKCQLKRNYGVECDKTEETMSHVKNNATEEFIYESLMPFSLYAITFNEMFHYGDGYQKEIRKTISVNTSETVPEPPSLSKDNNNPKIKWNMSNCHGRILGYELTCIGKRSYNASFAEQYIINISSPCTEYQLNKMKKGTNYTVLLSGRTSAGLGKSSNITFETDISEPEPPEVSGMLVYNITDATAVLPLKLVAEVNGPISAYQIIIKKLKKKLPSKRSLSDMCQRSDIPAFNSAASNDLYITAEIPGSALGSAFTIGDGNMYQGYYNAPLLPEAHYTAIIRIVSTWNKVTKYSCSEYDSFSVSPRIVKESNAAWVASGSSLGILVIILAMAIGYRRLSRKCQRNTEEMESISLINKGNVDTEIQVKDLLTYAIRKKKLEYENEDDEESVGLAKEYSSIPCDLIHPNTVATQPHNKGKNRYINITPYDQSRVVLQATSNKEDSDYINASYLDGYKKTNCYIATQGPLASTVDEFWRMIWQEKSEVIVMLTNLIEQEKAKCVKYWPEQSQQYSDFTVTLSSVKRTLEVVIRTFRVKKEDSSMERTVTQFHYISWPDHGVPKKLTGLRSLLKRVNECNIPGSGPIVVHCSAGIGRTGTFIALDCLLKRAEEEGKVDVMQCVKKLREKRVNMVQTVEQYIFLYDSLVEFLICGDTSVEVQDLYDKMKGMEWIDPATGKDRYTTEFETLQKFSDLYMFRPCRNAHKQLNKHKNRNSEILPADDVITHLMSLTNENGSASYINAVFADRYNKQYGFVITHLPLKETLADFWALVYDYSCTTLIIMNEIQDLDETYPAFWPESGECSYGLFNVQKVLTKQSVGYTVTSLKLRKQKKETPVHLINLIQLKDWLMHQCLPRSDTIIKMLTEVQSLQQKPDDGTVLVTCCNNTNFVTNWLCPCIHLLKPMETEKVQYKWIIYETMDVPRTASEMSKKPYIYCNTCSSEYRRISVK
ncbi:receptor-type tyrosine-protein phosphatase kappa-like isoform X2 [Acipenser ruthenus]|uniref:receptor-type tyrosine-protein phosphatase kappa-like isoform X2 n=1 Tax=Acipenser ruthenus TaxID=7906 RepID=UPI00274165A0|nr:receptor-type tyrosine-protein phosphatase kappa-like isoform X2 [Acipenser ruthenus]